jgi:hypothetical protein
MFLVFLSEKLFDGPKMTFKMPQCERIRSENVSLCRSFDSASILATWYKIAAAFPTEESFSEQFGDTNPSTFGYVLRNSDGICGIFSLRRLLGVQLGRPPLTVAALTYCIGENTAEMVPWIIRMAITDLDAALLTTLDQGAVRRDLVTIGGFSPSRSDRLKYHFFNYKAPTIRPDNVELFMV